jgi:hypothetical protein
MHIQNGGEDKPLTLTEELLPYVVILSSRSCAAFAL